MMKKIRQCFILLFIVCLLCGCSAAVVPPSGADESSGTPTCDVQVHFIDVGQGDSILIRSGDSAMLIDAGTNEYASSVTSYISDLGITHLDWVVGTHPHEDHIGGLDDVIEQFDVDRVMLPPKEHTTKTFEDVLDAIESKNLSVTSPIPGDTYELGSCEFTVLGPVKDYGSDLNNWSVVLRLVCGQNSFLFTGDIEDEAETDILDQHLIQNCDVLKVAHHGSDTSTSSSFLSSAAPEYAIISVGQDNDYGHPCQSTLDKFTNSGITVYRTDLQGTIIVSGDGKNLSFSPDQTDESRYDTDDNCLVHITRTGKKYHRKGCAALKDSDMTITLDKAKDMGYTPCKQCNPPE